MQMIILLEECLSLIHILGFLASGITLSDAAVRTIKSHAYIFIPIGLAVLALFVYCIIHMFSINYMAYDGGDISDSKRKSRQMVRVRGLRSFGLVFGWNVALLAVIYIVYFIMIILISLGVTILDKANLGMALFLSLIHI